jgi:hypothetical protein
MILAKILLIAYPKNGENFFEEIKVHYAHQGNNPKITLEKIVRLHFTS